MICERCGDKIPDKQVYHVDVSNPERGSEYEYDVDICGECAKKVAQVLDGQGVPCSSKG